MDKDTQHEITTKYVKELYSKATHHTEQARIFGEEGFGQLSIILYQLAERESDLRERLAATVGLATIPTTEELLTLREPEEYVNYYLENSLREIDELRQAITSLEGAGSTAAGILKEYLALREEGLTWQDAQIDTINESGVEKWRELMR
ncbi:MAG: hypothetical protein J1F07_05870 [Muribaculaceae bacterium]|nr:hypothetical protein [Muribaculaceae bacterium]